MQTNVMRSKSLFRCLVSPKYGVFSSIKKRFSPVCGLHFFSSEAAPPRDGCLRDKFKCRVADPVVDAGNKVTIVGAGAVGIACANAILFQRISSHLAIVDAFPKKLKGEGLDFCHGSVFLDNPKVEFDTEMCISSNSKVVVVAVDAGNQETKKCSCMKNADIVRNLMVPLLDYSPDAVFVVVSYPVDVMTWVAWKISGLPTGRVIGSGTHLDTARFRFMIANRMGVAASSVHGLIIGESGETQVPLWSGVNIAGVQFRDVMPNIALSTDEEKWNDIVKHCINAGSTVCCLKGYENTSIGLAVADIVKDVLRNAQTVKPVSTLAQGHYDICTETFLSLPCTIGQNGVSNVIRLRITEEETKMLQASAAAVHKCQKLIKF